MIFISIIVLFVLVVIIYMFQINKISPQQRSINTELSYKKRKLVKSIEKYNKLKKKLEDLYRKAKKEFNRINFISGYTKPSSLDNRINIHLDLYDESRKDLIGF